MLAWVTSSIHKDWGASGVRQASGREGISWPAKGQKGGEQVERLEASLMDRISLISRREFRSQCLRIQSRTGNDVAFNIPTYEQVRVTCKYPPLILHRLCSQFMCIYMTETKYLSH